MKPKTTVKELLANGIEETKQVQHLRHEIKSLNGRISKLSESLGNRQEVVDQICGAIVAVEPFPPFRAPKLAKRDGAKVSAVLKLSDWHIGEVIKAGEIEGFNKFNWQIAQERVWSIVDSFSKWIATQRSSYQIDECAIFCEGDFVSGDIHLELQKTNEFPLAQQIANAGDLLGEAIRRIAALFPQVNVYMIAADNHSRLTPKPQAKQKSTAGMGWVVQHIAKLYAQKCTNVNYVVSEGMKHLVTVNGFRFLIEHGDTIKGNMGIPYYGFAREKGREAIRRMNTDKGFHYLSIGHWHVASIIEGDQLVNGSLSGTSEYDHSCGRKSIPAQVAFLVGKHGIFNWVPFHGVR